MNVLIFVNLVIFTYIFRIADDSDSFSVISPLETTDSGRLEQDMCLFFPSPDSEMGLIEEAFLKILEEVH